MRGNISGNATKQSVAAGYFMCLCFKMAQVFFLLMSNKQCYNSKLLKQATWSSGGVCRVPPHVLVCSQTCHPRLTFIAVFMSPPCNIILIYFTGHKNCKKSLYVQFLWNHGSWACRTAHTVPYTSLENIQHCFVVVPGWLHCLSSLWRCIFNYLMPAKWYNFILFPQNNGAEQSVQQIWCQ